MLTDDDRKWLDGMDGPGIVNYWVQYRSKTERMADFDWLIRKVRGLDEEIRELTKPRFRDGSITETGP